MKLSNLSLAILVALGTAACGGSDDNNNQAQDPNTPQTPQTPQTPVDPKADNSALVDPTKTQVVDQKDLSMVESVGTLQYIRRDGSQYDRNYNPTQPASASPYLGVHLDDQNPKLTNIVLARQELVRTDGTPVKAQFTGSTNREPLKTDGTVAPTQVTTSGNAPLQIENFTNVDVLGGAFAPNANKANSHTADTVYKNRMFQDGNGTVRNRVDTITAAATATDAVTYIRNTQTGKLEVLTDTTITDLTDKLGTTGHPEGTPVTTVPTNVTAIRTTQVKDKDTAVSAPGKALAENYGNVSVYKQFEQNTSGTKAGVGVVGVKDLNTLAAAGISTRRYGGHLVWWSSPDDAFETVASQQGKTPDADAKDATTGLVRVGGNAETLGEELTWNSADSKWEDHHNTTTRIFGRYHLAFADKGKVNPVTLNTFVGASSFVSEVDLPASLTIQPTDAADAIQKGQTKAKSYSIGAVPGTLENVQYGRVTTNLDLELDAPTYGDGFMHAPYAQKNADDSVDNYFYRGTNATTVAEMAALPTDKELVYHGHALMYGIDNSYHGASGRKDLPNAFAYGAGEGQLGLGNFVEATANLATKKLTGTVYNAWLLDQSKAAITKDVLVNFSGDIAGNSAWGSADRAYIAGDDKADFRASFFGDKAEELGGSFNSVQSIPANGNEAYGSAYGAGDWGGVFGAKQAGSGNTFQGDDGANVYTGLSN